MNQCPHPECNKTKPREHYACPHHWFSLPARIKARIYAGYRGIGGVSWSNADQEARDFWAKKDKKGQ